MTNKEKFRQIFGNEYELPLRQYTTKDWWEQEYIEPCETTSTDEPMTIIYPTIMASELDKIVTQAVEEEDKFIFTTIKSYCEEITKREISKKDLEQALIQYFSKEPCDDAISREVVLQKQYRIDDSVTLSTRDVVNVEDIEDAPSVTLCKDAISRMLAQEEITKSIELKENPHQLWERIQDLPSVTPSRRKGHWKYFYQDYECSECGFVVADSDVEVDGYEFCPICGSYNGGDTNG